MRPNKKKKNRQHKSNKGLAYQDLEQRQLLATLGFNATSGQLDVDFDTANQTVVISSNAAGEITVDGSRDLNTNAAGIQPGLVTALNTLNINGNALTTNQNVALNGNFAGVNGLGVSNAIQTLNVSNVSQVTIVGQYEITGDATVVLEGVGGGLGDGDGSSFSVAGVTDIAARNNTVLLNDNVDLNTVNVSTLGGFDVTIADQNSLVLNTVSVSGDLDLTAGDPALNAGASITDTASAFIDVAGDGIFTAASVTLGEQTTDSVNFRRTAFDVTGQVELHEDSNIIFLSSNAGSLIADSAGGIFDGRTTDINVAGNSTLIANGSIRLGEHGIDTFNTGTLTFQAGNHVDIFEDSGTLLVGESFSRTLDLTSLGDLTDSADATLTTQFFTGLEGDNVVLGDGDTSINQVDLGGLYFFSLGDIDITEQGDVFIIEEKNQADRLTLTSVTGNIADDDIAKVTVNRLATFNARDEMNGGNVTIGDSLDDRFNAGSIRFDVANQFFYREDSGTNLAGNSSSAGANIGAAGNITNAEEATFNVDGVTRLLGNDVLVGNETDDVFNFGSLVVTADRNAFIAEDSATVFAGNSTADLLAISSTESISNIAGATLNVARVANFQAAEEISIGNATDDEFNATAITVNTPEDAVRISEDSATIITGSSNARAIAIESTGSILNAAGSSIIVDTNLSFDASGAINVGNQTDDITGEDADRVEFSSVTFNSPGNVAIETNRNAIITGQNTGAIVNLIAQDRLTNTFFNIVDQTDAEIQVAGSFFLTGLDVLIGEGDMDSLLVGGIVIDSNGPDVGTFNVFEDDDVV